MKRRWKIAILLGVLLAILASPIVYIETSCGGAPAGWAADAPYASVQPGDAGKRPEGRTWLTWPEWYIVYSADSYARWLAAGNRPSGYSYGREITGFWSGLCQVNRVAGPKGAGEAKLMLYTIGLSFSVEMAVKGFYENVFGRIAEWIGGWKSPTDRKNAEIWKDYGSFMHETPWYGFDFGKAAGGLWNAPGNSYRDWERRLAIGTEYVVKALYAKLIGAASGATLGRDELTLRFVARGNSQAILAADERFEFVQDLPGGLVVIEAPRYAQFSALMGVLSRTQVELVEIAGNDDILVTMLLPDAAPLPKGTAPLFEQPLEDRPGWRRAGVAVKVPQLLPLLRAPGGAEIEHVYDY